MRPYYALIMSWYYSSFKIALVHYLPPDLFFFYCTKDCLSFTHCETHIPYLSILLALAWTFPVRLCSGNKAASSMQDVIAKSGGSGQEEGKHTLALLILSQYLVLQEFETKSQSTIVLYYLYQEEWNQVF